MDSPAAFPTWISMIECFYFDHDAPPWEETATRGWLTPDELAQAARFVFPKPRREFLLTRGALRRLLAQRLAAEPNSLSFLKNGAGKPYLEAHPVHFNVSHAHGVSLIAIAAAGPVGVDVEAVRNLDSREAMARRWFHPAEVTALEQRNWDQEAFFVLWTAKEAVVKALGTGLGFGMDEVRIDLDQELRPTLGQLGKSADPPKSWQLISRTVSRGHRAAVAYQGPIQPIAWRELGNPPECLK